MIAAPPRISLLRVGLPAAVIFACAILFGWEAGDTAIAPPAPRPPLRWSLPPPATRNTAKDFAAVMASRPWDRHSPLAGPARPESGRPGAPPPNWRLAGIVERGGTSFALIASGAGAMAKFAYLRVGDRLPDGAVLVALRRDSATVKPAKPPRARPRIYHLFGKKP